MRLSDNSGWREHLSEVPALCVSKLPGSIWAPSRPGLWARLSLFLVGAGWAVGGLGTGGIGAGEAPFPRGAACQAAGRRTPGVWMGSAHLPGSDGNRRSRLKHFECEQ